MRRALSFLLFVLCFAAQSRANVTDIRLSNPSRVPDEEIFRIFRPKPGDAYDASEVRRSIGLLTALPGVRNVLVRIKTVGEDTEIALDVVPQPLVRDIDISGVDLFKKDEVLAGFRTRIDGPVYQPYLDSDVEELRKRYDDEGYVDTRIEAKMLATKSPDWVDVVFEVSEGEPLLVIAYGDLGEADKFGRDKVLELLGMEKDAIASQGQLRKGVKELLDVLHKDGYPEARVTKAWFDRKPEGVLLNVPLILGERTEIEVRGGDTSTLEAIVLERLGTTLDEAWRSQTASRLRDQMVSEGYLNAEVVASLEKDSEGGRVIVFDVTPGVLVKLDKVEFRGNLSINATRLRDVMKSVETEYLSAPPLRRSVLDADLEILKQLYATEGFVAAQAKVADISVSSQGRAVVTIQIEEGLPYRLRNINYAMTPGVMTVEQAARISGLTSGQKADPAVVDKARVLLLAELSKKGYLEASVEQEVDFVPDAPLVDVTLKIVTGPLRRIGTVIVSGNARTDANVILREVSLKTGEPWNPQDVLTSRHRIFRLGFFQEVQIAPVGDPHPDGSLDAMVTVREQDAGRVDYGAGYGSAEGVSAFLEIGHSNIMGVGRSLSLRLETEGPNRSYSLNFREPWIYDSPYDLRLSLISQRVKREAYTLDATALQASLDHEFSPTTRGSLLYTLEENRLSNVDKSVVLTSKDDSPYLLSSIGPLLVWDSRDDPFNPRKGYYHSFQVEWALTAIGSQVDYTKYLGMMSGYFSLDRFTLALLARGGLADFIGKEMVLPLNKRFFLGGRSSVRGFARDQVGPKSDDGTPMGGDVMANLKAELRFPVYKDFGMALFWDAGQVWIRDQEKVSWGTLRHAAGGGLRYNTPVGPISLDVGWKLDRKEGETPYEWYFTIGNVF